MRMRYATNKTVHVCVECFDVFIVVLVYCVFLSASLYVSKRGAYRLCRDVVGRWSLVGCRAHALWPNGAS